MQKILRRILFLSRGDTYGAYEFLYRMAKFMENDYEIAMVVRDKRKADQWISKLQFVIPRKKLYTRILNYTKRKLGIRIESLNTDPRYIFLPSEDESISFISAEEILKSVPFVPEVIISGMTDGFLNTTTLLNLHKITGARVFQVMIDMSLLTGGCHVIQGCEGFKNYCSICPAIISKKFYDFASINFAIKKRNILEGDFKLIVISGWTVHQANISVLYRNRVKLINSSIIDTDVFNNVNRKIAKQIFNIPKNAKVLFAGSNNAKDIRKGRSYLIEALSYIWENNALPDRNAIWILLAGNHNTEDEMISKIKFNKKLIPFITDDRFLSLAYQASDIFVCPSLEDGGPMMVAEALACGTPVVGFETGLLFDETLVQNGLNGYRVEMKNSHELAIAIQKIIILNDDSFRKMSDNARKQASVHASKDAFLKSIADI